MEYTSCTGGFLGKITAINGITEIIEGLIIPNSDFIMIFKERNYLIPRRRSSINNFRA